MVNSFSPNVSKIEVYCLRSDATNIKNLMVFVLDFFIA